MEKDKLQDQINTDIKLYVGDLIFKNIALTSQLENLIVENERLNKLLKEKEGVDNGNKPR